MLSHYRTELKLKTMTDPTQTTREQIREVSQPCLRCGDMTHHENLIQGLCTWCYDTSEVCDCGQRCAFGETVMIDNERLCPTCQKIYLEQNENWLQIHGYNHYSISNFGNIKSGETIMKAWINSRGYKIIHLSQEGISKTLYVHRLVAQNQKHAYANGLKTIAHQKRGQEW